MKKNRRKFATEETVDKELSIIRMFRIFFKRRAFFLALLVLFPSYTVNSFEKSVENLHYKTHCIQDITDDNNKLDVFATEAQNTTYTLIINVCESSIMLYRHYHQQKIVLKTLVMHRKSLNKKFD